MWIFNDHRRLKAEEAEGGKSKVEELRTHRTSGASVGGQSASGSERAARTLRDFQFPVISSLFRSLLCLLIATGCFMASTHGLFAALGLYQVQEIKPNIFVWIPDDVIDQDCDPLFTRAATAGFIVTPEGVVVVDTSNSPMHGRDLLYEIRRRTDLPIPYVIDTSSAADHMLGNEVFTDEESTLISTRAAQSGMQQYRQELFDRMHAEDGWRLQARMRGFHVTPSTQAFDDKMTLMVGGQEIRMISLLHDTTSPEETAVYLPSEKVLFLGELFDNQYFPRVGTRDVRHWIEVLRQIEGWDVDTYVPGHGAPGSKKDLTDFRKFLEWLVAQAEIQMKKGNSIQDAQRTLFLPRIYHWHAPELAADTVADVCRQFAPQNSSTSPTQPSGH
jgi:glyoxylase-like metal-dependent hydrolase (beta-lactamase superfamily II)